ncbi:hypothetical protein CQJ94_16545 [Glycomyces fuscus]|nr:hypothetical protein CQJ94_16545 [Glycomyces fuscus]
MARGLPELGWCVDDEGIRAVRPYLVAHEQRQRRALGQVPSPEPQGADVLAVRGPEAAGEWDELTSLVRQWKAQRERVPVA